MPILRICQKGYAKHQRSTCSFRSFRSFFWSLIPAFWSIAVLTHHPCLVTRASYGESASQIPRTLKRSIKSGWRGCRDPTDTRCEKTIAVRRASKLTSYGFPYPKRLSIMLQLFQHVRIPPMVKRIKKKERPSVVSTQAAYDIMKLIFRSSLDDRTMIFFWLDAMSSLSLRHFHFPFFISFQCSHW